MTDDVNSGPGWYEVIHPAAATTEIVRVMEDGSIYCPEGVLTRTEFAFAAARGDVHLLVRADKAAGEYASVLQELQKGLERFDPYAFYAEATEILNRWEF